MQKREINPTDWLLAFNINHGCKPVCTLLGVAALFEPEIMIELEATAVA